MHVLCVYEEKEGEIVNALHVGVHEIRVLRANLQLLSMPFPHKIKQQA